MIPLLGLSVLAFGAILERGWFWLRTLSRERELAGRILEAVREDWATTRSAAKKARDQPIGRFLLTAMRLEDPEPESFKLALESAAEEELIAMRKGEKIFEAVIALSPLLGLLGTVLGLIHSLGSIRMSDLGTDATSGVTLGIGEALISTATGLIVAVVTLAFYRFFQAITYGQAKLFRRAGNDLELLYRQLYSKGFRPSESLAQERGRRRERWNRVGERREKAQGDRAEEEDDDDEDSAEDL